MFTKRLTIIFAVVILAVAITLIIIGISPVNAAGTINVNLGATKQSIKGFGGMNHTTWIADLTDAQRTTAFGNGAGQIGMSILRIHVDESSSNWSREIATAQRAIALGAVVFASPWNPPASMTEVVNGQKRLRYDQYGAYVNHLNSFSSYMQQNGASLYAISVQNEPDYAQDWTGWTPTEMLNFMKNNAGSIQGRVIAPESFQYRKVMSDPILNDAQALANMDILGAHLYGTALSDFPYPLFDQKGAGKERWMTEVYTDSTTDANSWPNALDVAYNIHNSMVEAQFNAYVTWYIRRSYGMLTENGAVSKRGYAMSQYAKFVRPGSVRVDATKNPTTNVYASAYKSGQNVVVVVVNRNTSAQSVTLSISGGTVSSLTKYTTSGSKSVANDGTVSNSNGSFTLNLDASSVTTFVGAIGGVVITPTPTRTVGVSPTRTNTPVTGPSLTPTRTATAPSSGGNVLTNADMEGGTTGWVVNGAGTLSSDTTQFHGGARSVKTTGRTANWNGIGQNVAVSNFPTSGQNWTVSVWVRSQTGTPTAKATIRLTASTTTYVNLASAAINSTGWTQLTGTVPVTWSGSLTGVLFYVETDAGTDNLYIDDASLSAGSAGPTVTPTRTPTTGSGPTNTPTRTLTPSAPTATPTPTQGSSGSTCSPVSSTITAPFTYDGAGTFCWQSSNLGAYINSWNANSITLNGVNVTNIYVASGSYPAKIGGYWYVSYNSAVSWSHFESK